MIKSNPFNLQFKDLQEKDYIQGGFDVFFSKRWRTRDLFFTGHIGANKQNLLIDWN